MPVARPFYLLDEESHPLPDEEPHAELWDARRRALSLGVRCIVAKLVDEDYVPMAYVGPNGWTGPKSKPPLHPNYVIPIKGKKEFS